MKQRWIKNRTNIISGKGRFFFIVTNIKRVWSTGGKGVGGQWLRRKQRKGGKEWGKRKEIRNNPGNVSSRLFLPLFPPTFFPPPPSPPPSMGWSEGDGDVSLVQVNVREIYLVSFSPSQLRENLPTPSQSLLHPFSHAHARNLLAALYLFT